jgi:hypothetical protein
VSAVVGRIADLEARVQRLVSMNTYLHVALNRTELLLDDAIDGMSVQAEHIWRLQQVLDNAFRRNGIGIPMAVDPPSLHVINGGKS